MDIQLVSSFSTTVSVLQRKKTQQLSHRKTFLKHRKHTHTLILLFLPAQHQFGVFGHVLLHQVIQESFEYVGEIF